MKKRLQSISVIFILNILHFISAYGMEGPKEEYYKKGQKYLEDENIPQAFQSFIRGANLGDKKSSEKFNKILNNHKVYSPSDRLPVEFLIIGSNRSDPFVIRYGNKLWGEGDYSYTKITPGLVTLDLEDLSL